MDIKQEYQPITALPKQLLLDVSNIIHSYSTALVRVTKGRDRKEIAQLVGSGTFVFSSNAYGILTAAHVVDLLKGKFSLGLTLKEQEHKYAIDSMHLAIRRIANGQVDSEGPDLAFIQLPTSEIPTIKATSTFYNLDRNRDRILSTPPDLDMGIWALCGVPDILTTDGASEIGFESRKEFYSRCGFGGIRSIYEVDGFDYCDFEVKYDSSPNIPESFGGVSGGGLWQIPLQKRPDQIIEAKEYILSGVAFYQTQRNGINRSIKCHSRKSIYDKAYQEVIKEIS
jgi:hypothetical protein